VPTPSPAAWSRRRGLPGAAAGRHARQGGLLIVAQWPAGHRRGCGRVRGQQYPQRAGRAGLAAAGPGGRRERPAGGDGTGVPVGQPVPVRLVHDVTAAPRRTGVHGQQAAAVAGQRVDGDPGHRPAQLVEAIAALRPRPGEVPGYATRVALRELGRRARFLDAQLGRLDELIGPLVTARAPGLLALHGVGPDTAALLLIAAGDHPERLRSESSWAHLCGAAPIPASSGKVSRHRLNRGGDRQANHALWRIVITRLGSRPGHPATRAYAGRRTKEGLSKKEIIRCLKRYVAREVYRQLRAGA